MNVKKIAIENIQEHLKREFIRVQLEINCNRHKINDLAKKNEVLKRERAKITTLINSLEKDK